MENSTLISKALNSIQEASNAIKRAEHLGNLRSVLKFAAINEMFVGYDVAGKSIAMFSGSKDFSTLLLDLVLEDLEKGRPPLSSLIKGSKQEMSSDGFFVALESSPHLLSKYPNYASLSRKEIWEMITKECFDFYKMGNKVK